MEYNPLITVKSLNKKSKGIEYTVDAEKLTCTCPAFLYGMTRPCKHMKAVLPPDALDKCKELAQTKSLNSVKIPKESGENMAGLFTVGHSNYTTAFLIKKLLIPNGITTLIDVRSVPYSRYNSQFNRSEFAAELYKAGIRYLYGGQYLGGKGKGCPSVETPVFKDAVARVLAIVEKENVALMCSERNPQQCHRAYKLVPYINKVLPDLTPQHITKGGLIDAKMMADEMPDSWFWHEFGGKATAA
jgi:hypothetical protein